jgi:hypothetical protein
MADRKRGTGVVGRMEKLFEDLLASKWTLVPGIVRKVNNAAVTCDVELKIRGDYVFNVLENVPVVFPKGGSTVLLMPISIGDVVLVGFSKYPMFNILIDNQVVVREKLEDSPKFQIIDAIVLAGFTLENETRSIPSGYAELSGNLEVSGSWIQFPRLTQVEIDAMIIGFGAGDAGKTWFNLDTSQWEGWDGSLVRVFAFTS